MIQDNLLAILRCPEDHSQLLPADEATVADINSAIRAGRIRNRAGQRLETPIDGGLVRAAGDLLYPIADQIPVMLSDEAIPLEDTGHWAGA
jgi:uncharacterized protein